MAADVRDAAPCTGPLAGVRVLDCTHVVAGSWCSMILADLGAEVIKIESPPGDMLRAKSGERGFSSFRFLNRNKRALAIDMGREEARAVLRRLADGADVFVENYRPGVLDKMGLGHADLAARNPRLVYCSISGFGADGPYSRRGGFDLTAQAMSGLMSFLGEPDRGAIPHPAPISDFTAGLYAAIGVLAALRERDASGQGQHVGTTLLGAAFTLAALQVGEYLETGFSPQPNGSRIVGGTPYEAFPTGEGSIVIAAANDHLWSRVAGVLDDPELSDERFATAAGRIAHRDAFHARMVEVLSRRPATQWVEDLAAAGVPVAKVNTMAEAVADPQLRHLGALVEVDGETHLATPIDLSRSPAQVRRTAPAVGQDSVAVLAELGLSEAEIAALLEQQLVFAST